MTPSEALAIEAQGGIKLNEAEVDIAAPRPPDRISPN